MLLTEELKLKEANEMKKTILKIIRDTETALNWIQWMRENRPLQFQGWTFLYRNNGIHMCTQYDEYVDYDWIWKNRRALNDLIRKKIRRNEMETKNIRNLPERLNKGDRVMIYHDPISRLREEGEATIVKVGKMMGNFSDGRSLYRCYVQFDDGEIVSRKVASEF